MKSISYQLYTYILLDIVVLIFSIFKGYTWVANTQIAFLSSIGIILLSYLSYLKNINKQINLLQDVIDDRDFIDELDDPFELYEDNSQENKKNKLKLSVKNLSKSKGAAFGIFRIVGYILLVCGFFLLLKMKSFSVIPYMVGISIVPFGSLINIFIHKRQLNKD